MRAILVDHDEASRTEFVRVAQSIQELSLAAIFKNAEEALEHLLQSEREIELAIINANLPWMGGVELAKRIQRTFPGIMIVFEMDPGGVAVEALRIRTAGYILKPFKPHDIVYAIESTRVLFRRYKRHVYARTFGHFDLFVDGHPVAFRSAKAKELLAVLIDRQGGIVTLEQVIAALWEERPSDDATRNLASKLSRTLRRELDRAGVGQIINVGRGTLSLNTEFVKCDLYEFLEGESRARRQYYGEYMSDYLWGENRIYALNRLIDERK